jgi:DNA repair photolyase
MRRLREAGLDTWLGLAPILPAITDDERSLDRLLGLVAATGVRHLFKNVLFLRSPTREKFMRWLATEFPSYVEAYTRAYGDKVYLSGRYRDALDRRVKELAAKHGFVEPEDDGDAPPEQLALF